MSILTTNYTIRKDFHFLKANMKEQIPVSVIIPMRNSATTVIKCLESVVKQKYPISEIIVVDNASADNSVELVKKYAKKSKIPVLLIQRKTNMGVGSSYNAGVRKSKSKLIIFLHSDSCPATVHEMTKLVKPVVDSKIVVASYPTALVPRKVWDTYNFWQKYRFTRLLGKEIGFNAKFDCIKKSAFVAVGGFDEKQFARDEAIGGEDADLFLRLKTKGELVLSTAQVIHLHYLGGDYSFSDHLKTRKMLARTYGRLLRLQWNKLPLSSKGRGLKIPFGALIFLVKPALAVVPFIPHLHVFGIGLLVLYALLNSRRMYMTSSTLKDPKILLLPFVDIFLVYYETFWTIQAFIFTKKNV